MDTARFASTVFLCCLLLLSGCATTSPKLRTMEVTAYCGCGQCCSWSRGSWKYLKLNFWDRYVSAGPSKGRSYSGLTASGTVPQEPYPGLFSVDSLTHPWLIPVRIIFFPWLFFSQDGTIAADTKFYSFGTRIHVPGYGWGVVEDRGGAIKGPKRLDLYFNSHQEANRWGRRQVKVRFQD